MAPLVILLLCLGQAGAQFPGISDRSEPDLEDALLRLLRKLRQEEFFDTLLIYGKDCVFHSLSKRLEVPTVLVSFGSTSFDWQFSSLTLILCCDDSAEQEGNNRTLLQTQKKRRLIYIEGDVQTEPVCTEYFEDEIYNIAVVREDFGNTKVIYACRVFQLPHFEEVSLEETRPIYTETFRNMHRYPISAMIDFLPPRSMVYVDKQTGETKLMGYVANLITNFAQRVNATLRLYTMEKNSSLREILWRVRTDQVDMGITLEVYVANRALDTASYPFLLTPYCVMIQVPAKLPYSQVYAMIVDPFVLSIIFCLFCILSGLLIYSRKMSWQDLNLANILLNDVSLRGLLGQSFPFPSNASKHLRLILIILGFASVMLNTMYEAYLQSYFTNPPTEPPIRSFQDFTKFNKKLAISRLEVDEMRMSKNVRFKDINENDLVIIENWTEYLFLRDSLNQSYNYLVTGDRWIAYEEQQKIFKKPLFYLSNDLCISHVTLVAIPLRRYLPYRHLFEDHILRQNEFGLVRYWMAHSFFDMVRLGLTTLEDLSPPNAFDSSLILQEVFWILQLYLAAMGLSITCFLLELLSTRREKVGKCLKRSIQKLWKKPRNTL